MTWRHLARAWGRLRPFWAVLGPTWGHLGAVLKPLEPSWNRHGAILGHLEPSWWLRGAILGHLEPPWWLCLRLGLGGFPASLLACREGFRRPPNALNSIHVILRQSTPRLFRLSPTCREAYRSRVRRPFSAMLLQICLSCTRQR